jgi:RNA-binding protein
MTSKERAELKSQAMKLDSIFQIGKSSLTPQMTEAVKNALHARELIKLSVLKNCTDDPNELARILAERTGSEVVQVIGKKIVLYKLNPEKEKKRTQKTSPKKKGVSR